MFNDGGVPNGTHLYVEAEDTGHGATGGVSLRSGSDVSNGLPASRVTPPRRLLPGSCLDLGEDARES